MSKELVQRLRHVSNMINVGEKIRWGEDTALMDQAADLIERQNRIIEHLVELFVDTTTVENPERELVVIEARALIAPEEGE